MTDTLPDLKKRDRQVLGLEDFAEADLAAIRAAAARAHRKTRHSFEDVERQP